PPDATDLHDEVIPLARRIAEPTARARALAAVAAHLPIELRDTLCGEALRSLEDAAGHTRTWILAALEIAERSPADAATLARWALDRARSIPRGESDRAWALAAVAEHLPEPERLGVSAEALAAARAILVPQCPASAKIDWERRVELGRVAYLPPRERAAAL